MILWFQFYIIILCFTYYLFSYSCALFHYIIRGTEYFTGGPNKVGSTILPPCPTLPHLHSQILKLSYKRLHFLFPQPFPFTPLYSSLASLPPFHLLSPASIFNTDYYYYISPLLLLLHCTLTASRNLARNRQKLGLSRDAAREVLSGKVEVSDLLTRPSPTDSSARPTCPHNLDTTLALLGQAERLPTYLPSYPSLQLEPHLRCPNCIIQTQLWRCFVGLGLGCFCSCNLAGLEADNFALFSKPHYYRVFSSLSLLVDQVTHWPSTSGPWVSPPPVVCVST